MSNDPTPRFDVRSMKIAAVVNSSSGRCGSHSGDELGACLAKLDLQPASLWCGPARELEKAVDKAISQRPDLLIVLGGDGTIRAAAERCSAGSTILAPLPGGTMNLLPHALYGARSWPAALKATLTKPIVRPVHGAEVAGRRFFAAGLFGGPSLLAEAREAARYGDLPLAVRKGLQAARQALNTELRCQVGGQGETRGEVVAILCPVASRRLPAETPLVEAAAIDLEGTVDALRLVLQAAFRDWRLDPTVRCMMTQSVEIIGDGAIPALLDGERFTLSQTVDVTVVPNAFRALAPG